MGEYELLNREVKLKDKTPVTQAVNIIMIMSAMWEIDFQGDKSHKEFLQRLSEEKIDGEQLKENILMDFNSQSYDHKSLYLDLMSVIFAYCFQAFREYMSNNETPTNLAWAYVVEAERELSAIDNYRFTQSKIKERASKAGKAAHENSDKQKIKNEVKQKFIDCNYPFHKRGYTTKFVDDMEDKYPQIVIRKTIENWVTELKKEKQQ